MGGHSRSSKAPRTVKAGPDFADPDYELAIGRVPARDAINAAQQGHDDISQQKRVLLINGSSRSDQICPGEMSKTYRLCKIAEPILIEQGYAVDFLDLSHQTSEMGTQIHSCKSCVSAETDGYIGYMKPYSTAHVALDGDDALQKDVRTAATSLGRAIKLQAESQFQQADEGLEPAMQK